MAAGFSSSARASLAPMVVSAGPSPETKAVIGGFSIIQVPTREEALEWAVKIAVACRCAQEVRELMDDPEA
jgi:hypothetical protein